MRPADLDAMRPLQRAELIYAQARSDLSQRLWRAALGATETAGQDFAQVASEAPHGVEALLAMLTEAPAAPASPAPSLGATPTRPSEALPAPMAELRTFESPVASSATASGALALGRNAALAPAIERAAARTGLPAPALAAIINAEAAKRPDGTWQTLSRNPRSSAAGLGQFLAGTWIGEAQRAGTWLNDTARERGWLTAAGRVDPAARSALLALRYDAEASINATADYARANIARLRSAGVPVDGDSGAIARVAYLGHHLGAGDAVRFLTQGLETGRARHLLNAQIGAAAAQARIARTGDAASAHRAWLLDYVGRQVQPQRFAESARDA